MKHPAMQQLLLALKGENPTGKEPVKKRYYPWLSPEDFNEIKKVRVQYDLLYHLDIGEKIDTHKIIASSNKCTITVGEILDVVDSLTLETKQELVKDDNIFVFVTYCLHNKYPQKMDRIDYDKNLMEIVRCTIINRLFEEPDNSKIIASIDSDKYSAGWLKEKLCKSSWFKNKSYRASYLKRCVRRVIVEDYLTKKIKNEQLLDSARFKLKVSELTYQMVVNKLYNNIVAPYDNIYFEDKDIDDIWQKSTRSYYDNELDTIITKRLKKDKIIFNSLLAKKLGIDIDKSRFKGHIVEK